MNRFTILAREGYNADGMAANIKDFTLREDGTDDTAHLLSRPDLSLYCLNLEHKEAVFVSTPPEVDLEEAPFYYEAQFEHAHAVFTVSFDTFLNLAVNPRDLTASALSGTLAGAEAVPEIVASARRIFVLAVGKAAARMMAAAEEHLAGRIAGAIAVVPAADLKSDAEAIAHDCNRCSHRG